MYEAQSMYNKALVEHQKKLGIDIFVFGFEHDNMATSYNNIGNVCLCKASTEMRYSSTRKASKSGPVCSAATLRR